MSDVGYKGGPRAVTAIALVKSLRIDDESMATIASTMKKHSENHGMWLSYKRELYKQKLQFERQIELKEAELVSRFAKTASTGVAVTNYSKYDVKLHPDMKRLREKLDEIKEAYEFVKDVDRLFSKRADIMANLLKIDHDVIIRDKRSAFDLNVELRHTIQSFNQLAESIGMPWRR